MLVAFYSKLLSPKYDKTRHFAICMKVRIGKTIVKLFYCHFPVLKYTKLFDDLNMLVAWNSKGTLRLRHVPLNEVVEKVLKYSQGDGFHLK